MSGGINNVSNENMNPNTFKPPQFNPNGKIVLPTSNKFNLNMIPPVTAP